MALRVADLDPSPAKRTSGRVIPLPQRPTAWRLPPRVYAPPSRRQRPRRPMAIRVSAPTPAD